MVFGDHIRSFDRSFDWLRNMFQKKEHFCDLVDMASNQEGDRSLVNDDKEVLIVNLLTKYKVKLWELKDLETDQDRSSDVGGLVFF